MPGSLSPKPFKEFATGADQIIEAGESVVALVGSGAEAAWLHTIKDGLIVHLRSFAT
jgi:hypothetical protein